MNEIKNADFMDTFPPALKRDGTMSALGQLIAGELHITANVAEKNMIYADIDSLAETWLDVLAYDLHVDWYDYDYPVQAKRDMIKTCVRIHQKIGTVYAVETALSTLYPDSKIEEWFEYGGKPLYFKVILDISESKVEADFLRIIKTVNIYKRLTAHLEAIQYKYVKTAAVRTGAVLKMGNKLKIRACKGWGHE